MRVEVIRAAMNRPAPTELRPYTLWHYQRQIVLYGSTVMTTMAGWCRHVPGRFCAAVSAGKGKFAAYLLPPAAAG